MSGNDGDNPKARGLKHIKNKKKYGRSRALPTAAPPTKTKSAPKLDSNWDRYESEPVEQHQINSSTDFSILANAPISHGSHFRFKHDKEMELTSVKPVELFKLDLNMLNLSISTIPFHIRNDITDSYFSKEEITVFNRIARDNQDKYQVFLNNSCDKANNKIIFECDSTLSESDVIPDKHSEEESPPQSQNSPMEKQPEITEPVLNSEPDLEQWLDDILDD